MTQPKEITRVVRERSDRTRRGNTAGLIKRDTASWRLRPELIAAVEEAYFQLNLDGVKIKRHDLREEIIKLGLGHLDEIRAKYDATAATETEEVKGAGDAQELNRLV